MAPWGRGRPQIRQSAGLACATPPPRAGSRRPCSRAIPLPGSRQQKSCRKHGVSRADGRAVMLGAVIEALSIGLEACKLWCAPRQVQRVGFDPGT